MVNMNGGFRYKLKLSLIPSTLIVQSLCDKALAKYCERVCLSPGDIIRSFLSKLHILDQADSLLYPLKSKYEENQQGHLSFDLPTAIAQMYVFLGNFGYTICINICGQKGFR